MYLSDVGTIAANLAGIPAISVPCGISESRLPIGLQIMAPWNHETSLLQLAGMYEQKLNWSERYKPNV
jgi:aspartyl-tRNA(Asn)/glutamyl-tRNA(Gln) amidotransferase subunit A